eukprot:jgi/Bigna1/72588/fgenesh1_pg.20_\
MTAHRQTPCPSPGYLRFLLGFYYFAALMDIFTFILYLPLMHPEAHGDWGWHFVHLTTWGGYVQSQRYFSMSPSANRNGSALHMHRDRFFGFAFSLGIFIAIGYWLVLFPVNPGGKSTLEYSPLDDLHQKFLDYCCCCCRSSSSNDALVEAKEDMMRGTSNSSIQSADVSAGLEMEKDVGSCGWNSVWPAKYEIVFGAVYVVWNLICYAFNHHYPYPVQAMIPIAAAVFLYPLVPISMAACHILGNKLESKIHAGSHDFISVA